MKHEVEDYIQSLDGEQGLLMHQLHQMLTIELGLVDKIRYRIPFYYGHSWICYLNPIKDTQVELAFIRGSELSNSHGLMQSKGRKQVCGIEIASIQDIPKHILIETIQEAIFLDTTSPYQPKRTK